MSTFILNWAENYQSVIELYQSADHPALSPKSGDLPWRVAVAYLFGGFCSTTWKTLQKNLTGRWGRGDAMHVAWLGSFSQCFLMISPNLLDIWPVLFLVPSRYETAHFLIVLGLPGDGYSLLGSKK